MGVSVRTCPGCGATRRSRRGGYCGKACRRRDHAVARALATDLGWIGAAGVLGERAARWRHRDYLARVEARQQLERASA